MFTKLNTHWMSFSRTVYSINVYKAQYSLKVVLQTLWSALMIIWTFGFYFIIYFSFIFFICFEFEKVGNSGAQLSPMFSKYTLSTYWCSAPTTDRLILHTAVFRFPLVASRSTFFIFTIKLFATIGRISSAAVERIYFARVLFFFCLKI